MTTARAFIKNEIALALDRLKEDSSAVFGIMTPQHMVEHLAVLFYLGRKEVGLPCITPEDKLPEVRAFLDTDEPFWKDFKGVGLPEDGLLDLRYPSLADAKAKLLSNIEAFYAFHEASPGVEILHPVFGKIGFEAWERFHYKHCIHHLQQFGALAADYPVVAKDG